MKKLILLVLVCALALPVFAATSPVKPGKWQVTMEMDMPGMPMKMPPTTITHCVTKEQVEHPESTIPKGARDQNCTVSDFKVDGNTVTWSMKCEGKEPVTGTGKITYDGDTYDGMMKLHVRDMDMTTKYKGKYLGECDK